LIVTHRTSLSDEWLASTIPATAGRGAGASASGLVVYVAETCGLTTTT